MAPAPNRSMDERAQGYQIGNIKGNKAADKINKEAVILEHESEGMFTLARLRAELERLQWGGQTLSACI